MKPRQSLEPSAGAGVATWMLVLIAGFFFSGGCERPRDAGPAKPQALTTDPAADDDFTARHNKALGLMGQFRYHEAHAAFEALHRERPADIEVTVNQALARVNMAGDEDLRAAQGMLEEVLRTVPEHLRANYGLGLLKMYLGPPLDPLPHFALAARLAPLDPDAAYLHARSLEQAEQSGPARNEYLRCLELDDRYASAVLGLARMAGQAGESETAQKWITQFEAIKADPRCRIFEFAYKRMGRLGEVATGAPVEPARLVPVPPGDRFGEAKKIAGLPGLFEAGDDGGTEGLNRATVVPADFYGDGGVELVVHRRGGAAVVLVGNSAGGWESVEWPWSAVGGVRSVLAGDLDQDGRPDIVLCRPAGNQLWLQTEAGQWKVSEDKVFADSGLGAGHGLLGDFDHDGDLDLLTTSQGGPPRLVNNNGDGSFRELGVDDGFDATALRGTAVAAGDFDNDRDVDLLVGGESHPTGLLVNGRQWRMEPESQVADQLARKGLRTALAADLDHDGWIDLVAWRDDSTGVWSRKLGRWAESSFAPTRNGTKLNDQSFALADVDGDGTDELLTVSVDQLLIRRIGEPEDIAISLPEDPRGWCLAAIQPELGWSFVMVDGEGTLWELPPGPGRHRFAAVSFTGKSSEAESMRSNRSGIGTRWKARIGERWTTGANWPLQTSAGQALQPTPIGLQGQPQIDFLSVDWTDGVFQTELAVGGDGWQVVEETQRQLASCPLLFAWNGNGFGFVTDVLGVGGIGFLAAPGQYAEPRPWENLVLDERRLQTRDGVLELRLGEPMEEACYLRAASLSAVDLPAGWDVVVDERMGITDPQPTGELNFFRQSHAVREARDGEGHDQTAAVRAADGTPADHGPVDARFIGLLEKEQRLEFSFDCPAGIEPGGTWALVIEGWLEYPYSQTVFAASQAGRSYEAASLDVSPDGKAWTTAWEQFGYPAGMPRTMLLPLPESCAGAAWFRLRTNMQVCWDQIRLVRLEECPGANVIGLPLQSAELRWSGFARRSTGAWMRPDYDYGHRTGTWDARHMPGWYTRFGDVRDVLDSDRGLVVFGPGEEVQLIFEAPSGPPLPGGRKYKLELKGWCKDLDLYTGTGDQLGPLPGAEDAAGTPSDEDDMSGRYRYRYESGPWLGTRLEQYQK